MRCIGASSSAPAPLPAGYTLYRGGGYSIGVPPGWRAGEEKDGVVDIREPGSSRFLRMITVGGTSDALAQLTGAEQQFAAKAVYKPYARVRLENISFRGLDAADWEFTFTLNGQLRHVVYRGVVTGGTSYGIYLSTPADRWEQSAQILKVASDTFLPGS